jgi:hypothetical protein
MLAWATPSLLLNNQTSPQFLEVERNCDIGPLIVELQKPAADGALKSFTNGNGPRDLIPFLKPAINPQVKPGNSCPGAEFTNDPQIDKSLAGELEHHSRVDRVDECGGCPARDGTDDMRVGTKVGHARSLLSCDREVLGEG